MVVAVVAEGSKVMSAGGTLTVNADEVISPLVKLTVVLVVVEGGLYLNTLLNQMHFPEPIGVPLKFDGLLLLVPGGQGV